jgi:hypothetical protein
MVWHISEAYQLSQKSTYAPQRMSFARQRCGLKGSNCSFKKYREKQHTSKTQRKPAWFGKMKKKQHLDRRLLMNSEKQQGIKKKYSEKQQGSKIQRKSKCFEKYRTKNTT